MPPVPRHLCRRRTCVDGWRPECIRLRTAKLSLGIQNEPVVPYQVRYAWTQSKSTYIYKSIEHITFFSKGMLIQWVPFGKVWYRRQSSLASKTLVNELHTAIVWGVAIAAPGCNFIQFLQVFPEGVGLAGFVASHDTKWAFAKQTSKQQSLPSSSKVTQTLAAKAAAKNTGGESCNTSLIGSFTHTHICQRGRSNQRKQRPTTNTLDAQATSRRVHQVEVATHRCPASGACHLRCEDPNSSCGRSIACRTWAVALQAGSQQPWRKVKNKTETNGLICTAYANQRVGCSIYSSCRVCRSLWARVRN